MNKFIRIAVIIVSLAMLFPALSNTRMTSQSQSMDESDMEEMHRMMPGMMRDMMEMMKEMMGMMKGAVQDEKDRKKLEEMIGHMEKMIKGYEEAVKGAEGKTAAGTQGSGALTQMAGDGGVTTAVTYLNPGEESPAFKIKLDTHSVDLDPYKLENVVFLRDDRGKEYGSPLVESPSGSGHHRSAILRFKGADVSKVTAIDLVIKDLAGIKERVFRFEMKK